LTSNQYRKDSPSTSTTGVQCSYRRLVLHSEALHHPRHPLAERSHGRTQKLGSSALCKVLGKVSLQYEKSICNVFNYSKPPRIRYGSLPFSKNRGKYVRYSTETLETLLDQFLSGLNTKRPTSSKGSLTSLASPSPAPSAPVLSSTPSDSKHHHRTVSTPTTAPTNTALSSSEKRKSHRSSKSEK